MWHLAPGRNCVFLFFPLSILGFGAPEAAFRSWFFHHFEASGAVLYVFRYCVLKPVELVFIGFKSDVLCCLSFWVCRSGSGLLELVLSLIRSRRMELFYLGSWLLCFEASWDISYFLTYYPLPTLCNKAMGTMLVLDPPTNAWCS